MQRDRSPGSTTTRKLAAAILLVVSTVAPAVVSAPPASASTAPIPAAGFTLSADYSKYDRLLRGLDRRLPHSRVAAVLRQAQHQQRPLQSVPPTGITGGFRFDQVDTDDCSSFPQGITTSRDALGNAHGGRYEGHDLAMISWYSQSGCGGSTVSSRITLADLDPRHPDSYADVLLVEPTGTAAAPSFDDVDIHVGGIAWYGDLLYVADTSNGMRVFDLRTILRTDPSGDEALIGRQSDGRYRAHHYSYVLPQIGTITDTSSGDPLLWSTVSVDRSSGSLVMAEYTCRERTATGACASPPLRPTRAVRFPFAHGSTKFARVTRATQALQTDHFKIQGVASHDGAWWFASSGDKTLYYDVPGSESVAHAWVSYCESLSYAEDRHGNEQLWSLREDAVNRYVFAVDAAQYRS